MQIVQVPNSNTQSSRSYKKASERKKTIDYFGSCLGTIAEQSESEMSTNSAYDGNKLSIRGIISENITEKENSAKNSVHIFKHNSHYDKMESKVMIKHHSCNLKEIEETHIPRIPKQFAIKPKILGVDHSTGRKRSKTTNDCDEDAFSNVTNSSDIVSCLKKKEGNLLKVKKSIFKIATKEVTAIIDENKFMYYSMGVRKCFLDFSLIPAKLEKDPTKCLFRIILLNCKKAFEFIAREAEYSDWVYSIEQHMLAYMRKRNKSLILNKPQFYKWEHINVNKFLNMADTGDILLFSTNCISSGVQRLITRSCFDHVALILRYSDARILFIEATSNEVRHLIREYRSAHGPILLSVEAKSIIRE